MKTLLKLVLLVLGIAEGLRAQPTTTTISDTLYSVDGSLASGSVSIRLNVSCVAPGGYLISNLTSDLVDVVNGVFSKALVPNDLCVPAGTSYQVTYTLTTASGTPSARLPEVWTVPTSGPAVSISSIRQSATPTVVSSLAIGALTGGTTKGDLIAYTGSAFVRVAAGSNGQVLSAASGETAGLDWIDSPLADAEITALAGLTSAANKCINFSGSGTAAVFNCTSYGRGLLDVADEAAFKALVNLEIGTDVQAYDADLTTYAGITPSANIQTLLGAASYAAMRTQLGLVIGTNVQAWDADLDTVATSSSTVGQVLRIGSGPTLAFGAVDLADGDAITGALPDANIPNLNTLSTGLTASRCVETDGSGLLTVTAGTCGSGAGDVLGGSSLSSSSVIPRVSSSGTLGPGSMTDNGDGIIILLDADGPNKLRVTAGSAQSTEDLFEIFDGTNDLVRVASTGALQVLSSGTPKQSFLTTAIRLASDVDFAFVDNVDVTAGSVNARISRSASATIRYGDASGSDGIYLHATNFSIQLGAQDSTAPQIVPSGADLVVALADNSATWTRIKVSDLIVNTTDLDGTPAIGKITVTGSTNDGSTYLYIGRDSDNANVIFIDTNGKINSGGLPSASGDVLVYGAGGFATDDCVKFNSVGRLVSAGAACGAGGGGGTWGSITGTLSNQTDLNTVLATKYDTCTAGPGIVCGESTVTVEPEVDDTEIPLFLVDSGAPSAPCTLGRHTYTNSATGAFYSCTATDTWTLLLAAATTATLTNKTLDAEGTGNVLTIPSFISIPAANCQASTAFTGWALPSSNSPAATCVAGSNTIYGTLAFDDSTDESAQVSFHTASDLSGAVDLDIRWRAAATSGNVVWGFQTACVADAETGDPAFNSAQLVTDATKGTTLQWNDVTQQTGITFTGCTANETLFLKVYRDADNGSDTMTGDAQLIDVRLKARRAM